MILNKILVGCILVVVAIWNFVDLVSAEENATYCQNVIPEYFSQRAGNSSEYYHVTPEGVLELIIYMEDPFDESIFNRKDVNKLSSLSFGDFYLYHYSLSIERDEPKRKDSFDTYFVTAVNRNVRIDFMNIGLSAVKDILSGCATESNQTVK